jgi:hypothetical protein
MTEVLETVHKGGKELLRGLWLPIGPKLGFDRMTAPVPEIMDGCCSTELQKREKKERSTFSPDEVPGISPGSTGSAAALQ